MITPLCLSACSHQGRNGLGNIYVWASGDGGEEDDCNCDGYAASMWTISINSAINDGQNAHYDESCSSTLASTFSNGAKDPNTGVVSRYRREMDYPIVLSEQFYSKRGFYIKKMFYLSQHRRKSILGQKLHISFIWNILKRLRIPFFICCTLSYRLPQIYMENARRLTAGRPPRHRKLREYSRLLLKLSECILFFYRISIDTGARRNI